MKKILLVILIAFSLLSCANKRKKALLFPFFAILDDQPTQTQTTSPATSSDSSSLSAPPAPTVLTSSASETYQIQPTEANQYAIAPTSAETTSSSAPIESTGTSAASQENLVSSSKPSTDEAVSSDQSASSASSPGTSEKDTTPSSKPPVTPSLSDQSLSASVEVTTKTEAFKFETTKSYTVNASVVDSNQTPIPNALIGFYEIDPKTGESSLIFQQLTNSEGRIQGNIIVKQATEQVEATVTIGSETSKPVPIPLVVAVTNANGTVVNMPILSISKITIPIVVTPPAQIADKDGDGVPDALDFYPNDPTKATKLRFPTEGVYTIAYEDLFPSAGDADLNDYVIQMFNEEDLDAQGRIVEIRGQYQHVARGAGYKHTLNLKLPRTSLTFESVIYDANGNDTRTGKVRYTPSIEELGDGIEILGDSSKTITSSNIDPTKPFKPGHRAAVTIRFDKPVSRTELGNSPYDLFIRILSKKVDSNYPAAAPIASNAALRYYEVHFPNLYFDSKGKDVYMDSKGFPWAILVPKVWAWPLEGSTYDIRGSKSAYPKFKIWMDSKGELEKDWYLYPNSNYAFPLPESSSLTAFLNNLNTVNVSMAIGITLIAVVFLIFRRKAALENN